MPNRYYSLLIAFTLVASAGVNLADERSLVFEEDIQPLLASKCGKCHADQVQKGGLNLSTISGVRRGGESGESAIGKSADDSPLWRMIEHEEMPPEGEPKLTDEERKKIQHWIATGAVSSASEATDAHSPTQHDVIPILLLRCAACHGARKKEGGVDLRTTASIRKGGTSGPVFVAGDPDKSLMIARIESEACPPRDLLLKFFVKRPPATEVEVLRRWIANGAIESDIQPDVATTQPDPMVTDQDRQHWAFQSPKLDAADKLRSVDDFLLSKLDSIGLTFSPEADRDTLIRRAYIDLIGMPPSREDWSHWHHTIDADWYQNMIERLLASPHYGERWGRYWLDLAGYADSEGGISSDPMREVAWKYRDYVIRAFNDDKRYDRFLLEQLSGDELLDHAKAEVITQEMVDNLIATGFLRMGIDQTGSRTMNFVPERLGVIGDAITVVGEGLLGLTLGCAKCHSHKYDPIPHRDYFRFKAIFQGALDENDWLTFKNRVLNVDTAERKQRFAEVNPKLAAELKPLQLNLNKAQSSLQLELLTQHYPDQSIADREETLRALKVADNSRSLAERHLVEMLQKVEVLPDDQQPPSVQAALATVANLQNEIRAIQRRMEPTLEIRALWDRGDPSPTYILRRGEHDKPSRLVGPGVPSVLTDGKTPFLTQPPFPGGTPKTGRRLAFAKWLTQPNHPLTARVLVNRIWYHHFGAGIVPTLENFGLQGERPSHPELLDWLAIEFVNRGWSIKEMHRLILHSRAYRQSSQVTELAHQLDPQNRFLSRMPLRRLDAEALRDSLLFISSRLDPRPGGPPDAIAIDHDGQVSVIPSDDFRWRRSVYLQYRRTEVPTFMETFDYPEMGPHCLSRNTSIVSPQSLLLMNNAHIRYLAKAFAESIEKTCLKSTVAATTQPNPWNSRIASIYEAALCRAPSQDEMQLGSETLDRLVNYWNGDNLMALATYCHTLFNSAAFLYVD
jgi:mono/diheme cytochrome c family protein